MFAKQADGSVENSKNSTFGLLTFMQRKSRYDGAKLRVVFRGTPQHIGRGPARGAEREWLLGSVPLLLASGLIGESLGEPEIAEPGPRIALAIDDYPVVVAADVDALPAL
jgi:hypothetical protein